MILAFFAIASAAQLVMQLDTADVRAGQTVGLTVQLTDAQVRRAPAIPASAGVSVEYASSQQRTEFINFQTSQLQTLRYEVVADAPGDYTIGPLQLRADGGTLVAPAVTLHVGDRPTSAGGVDELAADLGTELAWVGQSVVYHLRYATNGRLVAAQSAAPEFVSWIAEPGVAPVTSNYKLGSGAQPLYVEEDWYAFRLKSPGTHTVPAAHLIAQLAVQHRSREPLFNDLGFTDVRNDTVVSAPLPLTIRALPETGRPASWSGLVGSFEASAKPSATAVEVGGTVTLDVTLSGDGGLAGVTLPAWSADGFRVYDDAPSVESHLTDGKLSSTARFKRAIVPEQPGTLTLPPLTLSWFDPHVGAYVEKTLDPVVLEVTGAASAASVESFSTATARPKAAVTSLGEDILPVRTDVSLSAPWSGRWAWLALLPGGLALLLQLAPHLRPRRVATVKAFGFADLPNDPEARLAGLERIFREAASLRLGRAAPLLRREDVAELGDEAAAIYVELDRARYRGGADLPEARVRAWVGGR